MKNNVLIIGGLGFIGHHLVRQLQGDFHVTVVDSRASYTPAELYSIRRSAIGNVTVHNINITDVAPTDFVQDFTTVVHLGSYPNIKEIERNPAQGISSLTHGVFHSIELAKKLGAQRFVYSSSSMVYGDFIQNPCPETHSRNPKSIYGIYKKAAEDLIISRCEMLDMDYTIIRPIAVYGPRDNDNRVISKFFKLARMGAELPVRGDTALDATYVMDTAQGFECAVRSENTNLIANISSGKSVTLHKVAEHIIDIVGSGSIQQLPKDPIYPNRGALDITTAETLLGYNPQYTIRQGLEEYDQFYRSTESVSRM